MDHQTALNTKAVERYTLDELTSPEREEFEDHFVSCPECATALREYEIFAANARAVFQEDLARESQPAAVPIKRNWWGKWFGIPVLVPACAAFALAFVLLRNPGAAGGTSEWTLAADERNTVSVHAISNSTEWLAPSIDLLPGATANRWAKFHWEVQDPNGRIVAQADEHDGKDQLTLRLPASKFEPGKKYKLIVQGDPASRPITGSFIITRT